MKTVDKLELILYAAHTDGLLQKLDPRVKLIGLMLLIVAVTLSAKLWLIAAILALAIALASLSRVTVAMLATRVWFGVLFFTGLIALPALFLTPEGSTRATFLVLRALTDSTLAMLLVFTTPWNNILKALRVLKMPIVIVVILGMTMRYILLLLQTARDMFEARRSRSVGRDSRTAVVRSANVLLTRTTQLGGEVYLAMQSRGFRGEVYLLDEFVMQSRDWLALTGFACIAVAAVWAGQP